MSVRMRAASLAEAPAAGTCINARLLAEDTGVVYRSLVVNGAAEWIAATSALAKDWFAPDPVTPAATAAALAGMSAAQIAGAVGRSFKRTIGDFNFSTSSNTGSGSTGTSDGNRPLFCYTDSGTTAGSRGALRTGRDGICLPGEDFRTAVAQSRKWMLPFAFEIMVLPWSITPVIGNGEMRITFGRGTTAGTPAEPCYGFAVTRNAGNTLFTFEALTYTTALVRTTFATVAHFAAGMVLPIEQIRITSRTGGVYEFQYGTQAPVTVTGGPTLDTAGLDGRYVWLEAENGASASGGGFYLAGLDVYRI